MSENKTSNDSGSIANGAAPDARRSGADASAAGVARDGAPHAPQAPQAPQTSTSPGSDPSATERASTDAPSSASTVEPVDKAAARRAEALEANAKVAPEPVVRAKPLDAKANLAESLEAATEAQAGSDIESIIAGTEAEPEPQPVKASVLPPEFTAAPDFGTLNPPPLPPPGQQTAGATQAPPAYLKQSDSAWSVFGRVIAARARQIFDRAGQRITQRTLRIGVSARIFHPEPGAKGLRGKTLQYLEESIAHWVMSRDVLVFMIPTVGTQGMLHPSNIRLRDYAKNLDGLLLQGGADVSPQSYEEVVTRPEWPGDRVRDMYELELLHEFIESGKPVLGVCRGCQLINVAFGGTLYGDIATEVPTAGIHVNEHYDQHRHSLRFPDGSTLANMFPNQRDAIVNSIHHQAVKSLGRDLNVEAVSAQDGIIEAVRYRKAPFVVGVQWHPEFHRAGGSELLDCTPLLDTFLRVARETRF
ncbi:gamma-glutamyl-gamma-aminobutyrate hydrolase family protein [Caballeronia sp. LP006]|jgi:gamma-glutamyl-gamma-aminobutyrate hydrolase PuuD|uniref:gamma-glutamyl-gamma-aminobutyrate hydrolase family protein n=1 Tax=Caballeronia sp. LP006 TaxID=3038552 RepID=UPI00285686B2|nr:gamma-glutamyl-gamma-aminobutyrate hydrolase family protein [Caballeronia sp. LP006]MDR5831873.1 gamma-glutamyl-gamma-aminobutyrate hydrolase family protein [Caballeronia sp. LP006]